MQASAQGFGVLVERINDCGRNGPNTRRATQVLMHDQPHGPVQRLLMRPDSHQTWRIVAQNTRHLRDACVGDRGVELNQRIIAPHGYARTVQRFTHEEWRHR